MTPAETTNQEQSFRVDMAAGFRWLQSWEMRDRAAGNLVARLPGQSEWMFTHTQGVYFSEIRSSDLFRVSFDDEAMDGSNQRSNYAAVNPSLKIFNARPDGNAIVHVHSHAVVAVSALECEILPITLLAFMFQHGEVAWIETDFNFPDDYCEQMAETPGDAKILMIRNHAFTAVGKTVAETMYLAYAITETCKLQIQILSTNQEFHVPTDEEIEYHAPGFTGENCRKMEDATIELEYDGPMEWTGLLRVPDREEPDYRN